MLTPWFAALFEGGHAKTTQLAGLYESLAAFMGAAFFDAGSVIKEIGVDGIHFTQQNNLDLGEALAPVVREMLAG